MTLLPSEADAFENSTPKAGHSLSQAFSSATLSQISAISGTILMTCVLGRILMHLHRPTANDNEADLNGAFWQRHRELDSTLSTISLELPDRLRLPAALPDSKAIFLNILLQTSVICLHQAAMFKAEKNKLPTAVITESRTRCVTGAREIGRFTRMMRNLDLSSVSDE
jgi:hypothetical protein